MVVRFALFVLAAAVFSAGGAQAVVDSHQPIAGHVAGWDDAPNAWSPDGRKIVFARTYSPESQDPGFQHDDLGVMNRDGSDRRQLVHKSNGDAELWDSGAKWSLDGSQILFQRLIGLENNEVFVVGAGGGAPRNLTNTPDEESSAAWSPDSRLIAFRRNSFDHPTRNGIWLMQPDGSAQVQRTHGDDYAPSWSPDGHTLAFDRSNGKDTGGTAVYTIAADGTGLRQVVGFGDNAVAGWSPDGQQVLFERGGDAGNLSIWTMHPDGSGKRKLTNGGDSSLSPDGTKLVFTRGQGARSKTFVADRNGRNPRFVFRGGGAGIWSPDGKELAFGATKGCRASGVYLVRVANGHSRRISNDCRVLGTPGADHLRGTNERDLMWGYAGNDVIDANPGDPKIVYYQRLDDDVIYAGPGNDRVFGGRGNDLIDGGPGRDYLNGGRGNDLIRARDGERDVVVCGRSTRDRVIADRIDQISSDCETVVY